MSILTVFVRTESFENEKLKIIFRTSYGRVEEIMHTYALTMSLFIYTSQKEVYLLQRMSGQMCNWCIAFYKTSSVKTGQLTNHHLIAELLL